MRDRRRLLRSFSLVAILGGTLLAGAGIGSALVGWSMEANVQAQYAALYAPGCPDGANCTTLAPVADWPEYQLGAQMVAMGELALGLGTTIAVGGAGIWRFLRTERPRSHSV